MNWIISLVGKLIPTFSGEKNKIAAVDTVFSKRGKTTQLEVILVMSEKILRTLVYAYLAWAIVNGKVNILETAQLLLN